MPATRSVVHSDPDILGGTLVFVGTRVPPTVSRDQTVAALEQAKDVAGHDSHS